MATFTVHTLDSAPAASKPLLIATEKVWGFIPKLHATLAESPITLEAYATLYDMIAKTSFTPIEQQVACLAVSTFHECGYCTAGHTYVARGAHVPEDVIAALREGGVPLAEPKLEALRVFTLAVLRERGLAGDGAVDRFLAAGFTNAQVMEVVMIISAKTISNYVNHLTHTPKETFMSDPAFGWVAPRHRK